MDAKHSVPGDAMEFEWMSWQTVIVAFVVYVAFVWFIGLFFSMVEGRQQ